ncbi:hypothetical protein TNCV_1280892 [Trichonephila clavipes]|nr:hypothetical protein TNCV_1280892 [Trichonephila clavipes]
MVEVIAVEALGYSSNEVTFYFRGMVEVIAVEALGYSSNEDSSSGSESLLSDNVRVSEPHLPFEEKAEKTVNEDKEAAVQLVNEVEKTRIKALEEELEMLKAQARMQQSEELEKLLEHFACIICAEIIDEPMVLNCSHSMCKYCLLKWKKKQNRCPICREKIVYEVKIFY